MDAIIYNTLTKVGGFTFDTYHTFIVLYMLGAAQLSIYTSMHIVNVVHIKPLLHGMPHYVIYVLHTTVCGYVLYTLLRNRKRLQGTRPEKCLIYTTATVYVIYNLR